MFQIYLLIFWIPAIVGTITLSIAWSNGIMRRPTLTVVAFLVGIVLQIVAGLFSPAWVVGLLIQVVLAVYLGIRLKLEL